MKMSPLEIKDRLTRLGLRREMEGNYTDHAICISAVELIEELEYRLEKATVEGAQ